MAIDERLIKALHVETLRKQDLHAEREPHVLFQASTFEALLESNYDGEVSFAELGEHGDLGLGTFDAVDGEMIAVDGEFFRATVDGSVHPVEPSRRTPFAIVTFFDPTHSFELPEALDEDGFMNALDARLGDPATAHALRVDGSFTRVRARSVARQHKPYPPMTEVAANQHVFELADVEGTMVGFRFPDYAKGINVPGYHLHLVTADRARGGHVLGCEPRDVDVQVDDSVDLHVELPAGVELSSPGATSDDALRSVEREG
ncbi:MAG: acetolactate decarboxylase [Solirubrobacterales bacterium]